MKDQPNNKIKTQKKQQQQNMNALFLKRIIVYLLTGFGTLTQKILYIFIVIHWVEKYFEIENIIP